MIEKLKHDSKVTNLELKRAALRTENEVSLKIGAMTRLETLREDVDQEEPKNKESESFWKDQCRNLV